MTYVIIFVKISLKINSMTNIDMIAENNFTYSENEKISTDLHDIFDIDSIDEGKLFDNIIKELQKIEELDRVVQKNERTTEKESADEVVKNHKSGIFKLNPELRNDILNDYKQGVSIVRISKKYNIKYKTLLSWKKKGHFI